MSQGTRQRSRGEKPPAQRGAEQSGAVEMDRRRGATSCLRGRWSGSGSLRREGKAGKTSLREQCVKVRQGPLEADVLSSGRVSGGGLSELAGGWATGQGGRTDPRSRAGCAVPSLRRVPFCVHLLVTLSDPPSFLGLLVCLEQERVESMSPQSVLYSGVTSGPHAPRALG